jgi:DNA-binding transcriptional LysR family regulator
VISTAQYFAPRLLAEFCRRHANVKLRLDVCNREAIIGHLERDDVDAAIMGRPPAELAVACEAESFSRHPHIAIAAPGHPLLKRRRIPVKALLEEPFISREPGSGTRLLFQNLFEKRGLPFAPTMVMNSNETIKQAVIAGMGVSFLSLHTVGLEIATGTLAALDVVGTPVVRRWYLVHRKEKRLSPAALAFRAFMLAEAASFVEAFTAPGTA